MILPAFLTFSAVIFDGDSFLYVQPREALYCKAQQIIAQADYTFLLTFFVLFDNMSSNKEKKKLFGEGGEKMLSDNKPLQIFSGIIAAGLTAAVQIVLSGYIAMGDVTEFLNMGIAAILSPIWVCAVLVVAAFVCARYELGVLFKTLLVCVLISPVLYGAACLVGLFYESESVTNIFDMIGIYIIFPTACSFTGIFENAEELFPALG